MLLATILPAQEKQTVDTNKKKPVLYDTLDGKLDFSSFLLDPKGFIPVPMIVTEPALGGFGGLLIPMFIKPAKTPPGSGYMPPTITAGAAMYTLNGSWALAAFRSGSIPKLSMKYKVGIGYASLNLSYYRTLPLVGEKEFSFNIATTPVLLSLSKKISKQDVYLGLQYVYMRSKAKPRFTGQVPDIIRQKELDNQTGALGVFLDWDKRNSVFTADKGARIHVLYSTNASWTASDFNYQRADASLNWFLPVKKIWVSGLRVEIQHVFDDPPFYLLPGISLRGVPAARYQGATTMLLETEQRFDVTPRWSVVGFGGLAKAIGRDQSVGEAKTVYSMGTGFRYLIARLFKIRAGVDIAYSPGSFGYYIVFGHNWNR